MVLNESYNDPTSDFFPSSALLFEREREWIALASMVCSDNTVVLEGNPDPVVRPFEMLFGLSVLGMEEYVPPAYVATKPSMPPSSFMTASELSC